MLPGRHKEKASAFRRWLVTRAYSPHPEPPVLRVGAIVQEGKYLPLMGLDYGAKTVGVAVSDGLGLAAQPLETIWRDSEKKLRKTLQRIETIVAERGITRIVLGHPSHLDGSEGERVAFCAQFKEKLEQRTGLPVVWQDEWLTTAEADERLAERGIPRAERKQYLDRLAAAIILQDYMDAHPEAR